MEIVKIGGVEMYKDEALEIMNDGMYIVTFSKVFKVMKKKNGMPYGKMVYKHEREKGSVGLVSRGRFCIMPYNRVNGLIGKNLLAKY